LTILVGDVSGSLREWNESARDMLREIDLFYSKIEAIAVPPRGRHFYIASSGYVWRVSDDSLHKERIFRLTSGVHSMACDPGESILFIEGVAWPYFIDLQRGALLLDTRPSNYDGNEPEQFDKSFVAEDWSAFIGVTSKRRWLRRSLADLLGIADNPARSIALRWQMETMRAGRASAWMC
jgi:hypothetical protein